MNSTGTRLFALTAAVLAIATWSQSCGPDDRPDAGEPDAGTFEIVDEQVLQFGDGDLVTYTLKTRHGTEPIAFSEVSKDDALGWLTVTATGRLAGRATGQTAAPAQLVVRAEDALHLTDTATVQISVGPCSPGATRECDAGQRGAVCYTGRSTCSDGGWSSCDTADAGPSTWTGHCGFGSPTQCGGCGDRGNTCVAGLCKCGNGTECGLANGSEFCCEQGGTYQCMVPNTLENCGRCGVDCQSTVYANTTPACQGGSCVYDCDPGFGRCPDEATSGECFDITGDPNHCGGCNDVCPSAGTAVNHATYDGGCSSEQCGMTCQAGWRDCNGNWRDGCEIDLTTTQNWRPHLRRRRLRHALQRRHRGVQRELLPQRSRTELRPLRRAVQ
jgi:hypothetical protein